MPEPRAARLYFLLSAPFLILAAGPSAAQEGDEDTKKGQTFELGAASLTATFDAGLAYYGVANPQFGGASTNQNGARAGHRDWFEGFLKPGLALEHGLGGGTVYGGVSAVSSFTRGNGDAQANSTTSMQPEFTALEDTVIGWRSGEVFARFGEDALDLSVGNQSFSVGDGFLLVDGTAEGSRRAAYVMGPRSAFARTAIAKINTDPVRADLFHLEGRVDQTRMLAGDAPATRLYGANVEWFASTHKDHGRAEYDERLWYVGLTALHVVDADSSGAFSFARGGAGNLAGSNRDGLNVYALRTGGAVLSGLSDTLNDFSLFSEYAIQKNHETNRRVDASAWYVEPQYTFSTMPWAPRISYRHARFSGDSNTNDTTDNSWDSLYSGGGPRGLGTWDQGEIYARYIGGNSNLISNMVHLKVTPLEGLNLGAIYYDHSFDKKPANVTSNALMQEVDAYAQWETPLKGLTLTLLGGLGVAGDGQKANATNTNAGNREAVDRRIWLGQILLGYSF